MGLNKVKLFLLSFLIACSVSLFANTLDTNLLMSKVYEAYDLQNSNPDSAIKLSKQVLSTSIENNFQAGVAYAYIRLGSIYNLRGRNDTAIILTKEAFRIRKSLKDIDGAIGTCYILSYIYEETGKIDSAYSILYEAIELNKLSGDSINEVDILTELGGLYIEYENINEAEKCFNQALNISYNISYELGETSSLSGLGRVAFFYKNFKKALNYFEETNEFYLKSKDQYSLAKNIEQIALCLVELYKFSEAAINYRKVIAIYDSLQYRQEQSTTLFNFGLMYINSGNQDSAIYFLNKSKIIAEVNGDVNRESRCFELLSKAYKLKGNYVSAYYNHLKYASLKDSIINLEKIQSISEMQTKYETELKEQQIVVLDNQNRTKTAQRNVLLAGLLVLLIAAIGIVYSYIQKNKIAKQNEKIAQQKLDTVMDEQEIKTYNAMLNGQEEERIRIANDLHDRLGSMLSTIKLMFGSLEEKIDVVQEENKIQYTKANNLIDEACVEVRRISHNLGAGMIANYGLAQSLEDLCETVNHTGKINCRLLTYNMDEGLPLKFEVELYRIVQEVVNNALKHAEATQITIQLNRLESELSLNIEDDGKGFDVDEKEQTEGMGLGSLKKRAEKLNGTLFIDSEIGKGTITIVEIPLV